MQDNKFELEEYSNLFKAYGLAENVVLKNYLRNLTQYSVIPIESSPLKNTDLESTVRLYKLEQLTYKNNDDITLKLSSLYSSVASSGGNIVVIIDSEGITTENINFYIGVRNDFGHQALTTTMEILEKSINGNFIGSSFYEVKDAKLTELVKNIFLESTSSVPVITSVSGVARIEKNEKQVVNHKNPYGIENFIEAMRGTAYTAIFIADSLPADEINRIRTGYENLYTSLVPLAKKQLSYNESNNKTVNMNISKSVTESITTGLSYSQSNSNSVNHGTSFSKSKGKNLGLSFILSAGANNSVSKAINEGQGSSDTQQEGHNKGSIKGSQEQHGKGIAEGYNQSYNFQIEVDNKKAIDLLERIDKQLRRINEKENAGMFNCCAYFIAGDKQDAIVVANTYKSLILGDSIESEASIVNVWADNVVKRNLLVEYLKKFVHPYFSADLNELDSVIYSNGSIVNGNELAVNVGFPMVSVPGLDINEHAPFGRNTLNYDDSVSIELGILHYMGNNNEKSKVKLNLNSLTSHTFVTGSTGAGKTNVVCNMLYELRKKKIKFLVIEPTKGEYKNVFGDMEDVHVYGTNPFETDLLLINPFSFASGIHVLEHIERLTEIFNACWPMYAAMPAVLKEAIERSYLYAGWDLNTSKNKYFKYDINLYPNFDDVLREVRYVIKNSEFSDDNQGDYIGALCTRVRSLTNGIYKPIFVNNDIDDHLLFDENVIIDLSRVFSSEVKSLLMGLLIMRLQEYRMSSELGFNNDLKHITVLEEAHNLLRRTSVEQSQESSNLMGKSVEMISNAIAEMRTYGEGFIIADQAPGLLDMSVIRNTNTKIILRLPEASDRELVGKAIALNEVQIIEIAKLDTGVAAIYQNNWKSAVLCQVNYVDSKEKKFDFNATRINYDGGLKNKILSVILNRDKCVELQVKIEKEIYKSTFGTESKISLLKLINTTKKTQKDILMENVICHEFFLESIFDNVKCYLNDVEIWYDEIRTALVNNNTYLTDENVIQKIIVLMTRCMAEQFDGNKYEDFLIRLIDYLEDQKKVK
ncbi:DUF87 domain-containing protein [Clostridium estertheticum]|uniref:ATP-binding protein n=1 Tax=Clostridium estertheticum TaxID=238834 RepID=UPI001C0E1E29|nr:ATP-binding protein [Clostridium estertheticum]MBU3178387.1 DUF87 domain-containing protein [Clostridium estertheticum]